MIFAFDRTDIENAKREYEQARDAYNEARARWRSASSTLRDLYKARDAARVAQRASHTITEEDISKAVDIVKAARGSK